MEEKPRDAAAGLFGQKFSFRLAWQGLMVGGLTLAAYFLGFTRLAAPGMEGAVANTMAFATLTLCQLFHAFNVRSEDRSLFAQGALSNPAMNRAFLVGGASTVGAAGASAPGRICGDCHGQRPVVSCLWAGGGPHSHLRDHQGAGTEGRARGAGGAVCRQRESKTVKVPPFQREKLIFT